MARPNTLDRAMERVEADSNSGCWLWTGALTSGGYGRVTFRQKGLLAHRYIYEATRGRITAGLCLRHKCDTRLCVNPSHLEPGTHAQNTADCIARGRWRPPAGEQHGNAKLSLAAVAAARAMLALGATQREVAGRLGVSQTTISDLARGKSWKGAGS